MIRKPQSLKTPFSFSLTTGGGNFDFLSRESSKKDAQSFSSEFKEEFEKDLNFIKKNLDQMNDKLLRNQLDYSSVYLLSKSWLTAYYSYLQSKVDNDILAFNNDSFKELNYFNQDVMEREALAEKFYKYHDDFRGLNTILKEYLSSDNFQIVDLNTLNYIKSRFKGNIIRREVLRRNEDTFIEYIPIRIQIIKFSNTEYQKFVNPEIYPSILSDFLEEKFLQIFSYMTVRDLAAEILQILNGEGKIALIPDVNLIRLWKLKTSTNFSDFIEHIKEHLNEGSNGTKTKIINIPGVCLDNKKELTFRELDFVNEDRLVVEIRDNSKSSWFFYDKTEKAEKIANNKRNFLEFLNSIDGEPEPELKEPKPNKIHVSSLDFPFPNKPSPNKFSYLSKIAPPTPSEKKIIPNPQNTPKGLVGIQNLGDTCFINVILQLFDNLEPIREFYLGGRHKFDSNYENQLSKVLENVLQNLWNGDSKSISPHTFYDSLKEKMPSFANYQQHDAHEFLLSFIDKLYQDRLLLNNNSNISIFKENLFGILRNTIICPNCEGRNVKFEPVLSLSLPIPQEGHEFLDDFYQTYYINDDLEANHRVICLNQSLHEKKLKLLNLAGFKEHVKKEMKTLEKNDIVLVACNEKIIWKMYDDEKEKIIEIYSLAKKENHTLAFIEINPEAALSTGSFLVFVAFVIQENELGRESFLSLPRFLLMKKSDGILKVLEKYVLNLLMKILNDSGLSAKKIEGCFDIKLRLFDLVGNINNVDICENCKKTSCNCKSFKSDEYYYEKEGQYEASSFKLFIKLAFISRKFSSEQLENLLLMKKSIKYNEKREITLLDCLQEFTKSEILNEENKWFCENCQKNTQGINQLDLFSVPRFLVFQLKRFNTENNNKGKIQTKVKFPLEKLDLTDLVKSQSNSKEIWRRDDVRADFNGSLVKIARDQEDFEKTEEIVYDLLGVINHLGNSLEKGHYFAYFRNELNGLWYKFDDRIVSQEIDEIVCSNDAYILIYSRK